MRRSPLFVASLGAVAAASSAGAQTIESRIVERIGETDVVLPSSISLRPGTSHRYRLQARVVPNGPTDALAGLLALVPGSIVTTGGINTRTATPPNPNPRGRLAPFTDAPQSGAEGLPDVDPFTAITNIDAAVLFRTVEWGCGGNGLPLPQPTPAPYARGTFMSLFEITSIVTVQTYTITYSGNFIAGREFRTFVCNPPDCGDPTTPDDDVPSACQYSPFPYAPQAFSITLTIHACRGEWNNDYAVNSQDVFDFIADFFAGHADINNDGLTNSDDFFQFVIGFVSGCL